MLFDVKANHLSIGRSEFFLFFHDLCIVTKKGNKMKQDAKDMTPFKANEIVTCIHCGYKGNIDWPTDDDGRYKKNFNMAFVQRDWDNTNMQSKAISPIIELTCPACSAQYRRSPLSAEN